MKRLVFISTCLLVFIAFLMIPEIDHAKAQTQKEKAFKAYDNFLKGKEGVFWCNTQVKIKGMKTPILLYSKKVERKFNDQEEECYAPESCSLYIYSKGKVKKVKTKFKGKVDLLNTNGSSYYIAWYKKKLIVQTPNSVRELYFKKNKLCGKSVWFKKSKMKYYQYKIKKGKIGKNKKMNSKKGMKFMNSGYDKSQALLFRKISW